MKRMPFYVMLTLIMVNWILILFVDCTTPGCSPEMTQAWARFCGLCLFTIIFFRDDFIATALPRLGYRYVICEPDDFK